MKNIEDALAVAESEVLYCFTANRRGFLIELYQDVNEEADSLSFWSREVGKKWF